MRKVQTSLNNEKWLLI